MMPSGGYRWHEAYRCLIPQIKSVGSSGLPQRIRFLESRIFGKVDSQLTTAGRGTHPDGLKGQIAGSGRIVGYLEVIRRGPPTKAA
jgi:hypothetical protein